MKVSTNSGSTRAPQVTAIVGAQWGDEGKGKLVDALAETAHCVVRFQGGNNAGHTLVVNGVKTKLSVIPSGVLHPQVKCLIGAGVVIDPEVLLGELSRLRESGVYLTPERLIIDGSATLILPYHTTIDTVREARHERTRIGTTGRGIGPAYEDRAGRIAIRFAELDSLSELRPRLESIVTDKNLLLERVYGVTTGCDFDALWQRIEGWATTLLPFCGEVSDTLYEEQKTGSRILFEGAQGTLLDLTHGTVPFVTSSSTLAGAFSTGCGVGPRFVDEVLGVTKAYTTRVGEGPFPTEIFGDEATELRDRGGEYGTVTGRPRRIGWLDLVMLKRAVHLNGLDSLALTKLDVLSGCTTLRLCTEYRSTERKGRPWRWSDGLAKIEPQYIELPGWTESLEGIRSVEQLPTAAITYLETVERLVDCPISLVSVGPERDQLFTR